MSSKNTGSEKKLCELSNLALVLPKPNWLNDFENKPHGRRLPASLASTVNAGGPHQSRPTKPPSLPPFSGSLDEGSSATARSTISYDKDFKKFEEENTPKEVKAKQREFEIAEPEPKGESWKSRLRPKKPHKESLDESSSALKADEKSEGMYEFPKLRISLTKEEIRQDFLAMTGKEPPKIPKEMRSKDDKQRLKPLLPGHQLSMRRSTNTQKIA